MQYSTQRVDQQKCDSVSLPCEGKWLGKKENHAGCKTGSSYMHKTPAAAAAVGVVHRLLIVMTGQCQG